MVMPHEIQQKKQFELNTTDMTENHEKLTY